MAKSPAVPFWLTLGFALGLGFAWWFFQPEPTKPRGAAPPAQPARVPEPPAPAVTRDAGTLGAVEALFQRWGGYAVWQDDVTEIAVWNLRRHAYCDFYEVRHVEGNFYFRTLPALTRPFIDHGVRGRLPLQFTETQAMHDEFHRLHPDYDPAAEPEVDLPPCSPRLSAPGNPRNSSLPRLTPGDGDEPYVPPAGR